MKLFSSGVDKEANLVILMSKKALIGLVKWNKSIILDQINLEYKPKKVGQNTYRKYNLRE